MENKESLKVVLLGDCSVGKTSIILRYTHDDFKENLISTVGSNSESKIIKIDEKEYKLDIWDTAGQELFDSVSKLLIQNCNIVIIVYSINDQKSFDNLDNWLNFAEESLDEDSYVVGIVGNKLDLKEEEETVSEETAQKYADKHKATFNLVSAKDGKDEIEKMFEELVKKYIDLKTKNNYYDKVRESYRLTKDTFIAEKKEKETKKVRCCK